MRAWLRPSLVSGGDGGCVKRLSEPKPFRLEQETRPLCALHQMPVGAFPVRFRGGVSLLSSPGLSSSRSPAVPVPRSERPYFSYCRIFQDSYKDHPQPPSQAPTHSLVPLSSPPCGSIRRCTGHDSYSMSSEFSFSPSSPSTRPRHTPD